MISLIIKINKPNLLFLIATRNAIKDIIATVIFATEALSNQARRRPTLICISACRKSPCFLSLKQRVAARMSVQDAADRKTSVGGEHNKKSSGATALSSVL